MCVNVIRFPNQNTHRTRVKQLIQKLEKEKEPIDKLMLLQQMNKELELIKKELLKKIK